MDLTTRQIEILRDMAADPNGENPYAVLFSDVHPMEQNGLVRFARVTRHARIAIYRITERGRRRVAESA